jgi:hypothetical protein
MGLQLGRLAGLGRFGLAPLGLPAASFLFQGLAVGFKLSLAAVNLLRPAIEPLFGLSR